MRLGARRKRGSGHDSTAPVAVAPGCTIGLSAGRAGGIAQGRSRDDGRSRLDRDSLDDLRCAGLQAAFLLVLLLVSFFVLLLVSFFVLLLVLVLDEEQ